MTRWKLSRKFSLRRSLAFRMLSVASFFLIVPLFLHSWLVYRDDMRLKKRSFLFLTQNVGEAYAQSLSKQLVDRQKELELIAQMRGPLTRDIVKKSSFSALYWSKKESTEFSLSLEASDQLVMKQPFPGKGTLIGHCSLRDLLSPLNSSFFSFHLSLQKEQRSSLEGEALSLSFPLSYGNLFLTIDVPLSSLDKLPQETTLVEKILRLIWLWIGLGGVGGGVLAYQMSRPYHRLTKEMEKLGEGDLNAHYYPLRWGFECNTLGHYFNRMVGSLRDHIHKVKELSAELKIGHDIQRSILPKDLPLWKNGDLGVYFLSAGLSLFSDGSQSFSRLRLFRITS
jgi:methyl-accepting chemotaxis protein